MAVITDTARPAPRPRALARWPERFPDKRIAAAAVFVFAVVLLSHMPNMLHYPYLEDDEGYYFAQGWAVFHQGRLTPYPYIYFYEHAPLGWIQMGLWQVLTAGASFGNSIASGRILMLLFQLGSSLLVFSIARKESGRIWVAVLAALIFTLSPLGIYYHRRVLLDNVTTFWILLSLRALVGKVTLCRVWLSAAALGVAFLSKEIALALVPAMAVLAARQVPRESRAFAIAGWPGVAAAVISIYPLMALLKGEFFPAGTTLGGHHKHVSLVCSLQWQTGRGPHDGGILNPSSQFWNQAAGWAHQEPLLVIGGSVAAVVSIILLRRNPVMSMVGWMILSMWIFLGNGGVLIDFYIMPILPLLALSVALVTGAMVRSITTLAPTKWSRLLRGLLAGGLCLGCLGGVLFAYQSSGLALWRVRQVDGQTSATHWIQGNIAPDSRMIIDMYMWQDLQHPSGAAPTFRNAEYYWKAGADPAIAKSIFADDWRTVNYVVTTPQLLLDTRNSGFSLIINALDHSTSVASFNTGGWPVDIRKVDPRLPDNHMIPPTTRRYDLPACMTYGT